MSPHLAPEHAPKPVVDPQLEALSQVSKIQDPEVIQRQRGGGRGQGSQRAQMKETTPSLRL